MTTEIFKKKKPTKNYLMKQRPNCTMSLQFLIPSQIKCLRLMRRCANGQRKTISLIFLFSFENVERVIEKSCLCHSFHCSFFVAVLFCFGNVYLCGKSTAVGSLSFAQINYSIDQIGQINACLML